jgi:hypothetical protein
LLMSPSCSFLVPSGQLRILAFRLGRIKTRLEEKGAISGAFLAAEKCC